MTLAAEPQACGAQPGHCITCGDEGVAMRVIEAGDLGALCQDETGERHEVAIDLVTPVRAGDELLVHAGVAIGRLGGDR
ncbi:MAG: HypC/HybG/HupF family hydrogenase formation chaperone [Solirubrobacteraceae bacterium]